MYSWDDPDDRVAIAEMNAELRHAQLDLLSARCSADRLRLRFSLDDLAQHAERDLLRKAIGHAVALSQYYLSIQKEIPEDGIPLSGSQYVLAVECVAAYLWEQRQVQLHAGRPLAAEHQEMLRPYFASSLLERVRFVELHGKRLPPPPFFEKAKALGIANLPEMTHMASLTFVDVIVFNEHLSQRALFHGLVHAAQMQILGLERYTDLFLRSFLRTQAHFNVPLERQAFALEAKFAASGNEPFSVEEQVRLWMRERRY
jgi:hypothetical protein